LPSLLVGVEWPSSKQAELGNTLKPKKLQDEPTVTLTRPKSETDSCSSVGNITYTLALTDPDAPSRDDPKWSEFCHWIATRLAISNDEDSSCFSSLKLSLTGLEEIMPYKPPGPPEKTGKHRYVLIVFAPGNGTTDPLHLTKPGDRQHWGYEYDGERVGVRRWSLENGLVPVGMSLLLLSLF
jgi:phosphatidylethanolamine-binding protein